MGKKVLGLAFLSMILGACQQEGQPVVEETVKNEKPEVVGAAEVDARPALEPEILEPIMSSDHKALAQTIHGFLADHGFNGVALAATEDEVILLDAFGIDNVAQETKLSVNHQFQIASVSKSFVAVSILQLMEQGLLTLDQTIDKYFPELPRGDEITIHHLLTHSSGLYSGDSLVNYSNFTTPDELIHYAFNPRNMIFDEPGVNTHYSNLGYDMLGVIVEIVSGMPYEQFLQRYILDVVGMPHSGLNVQNEELPMLTTAYAGHITKGEEARVFHPSFGFSSGGMHATAMDLFRYSQALRDNLLISEESYELMVTPHFKVGRSYHGYGFFLDARDLEGSISHTGNLLGWHSILLRHRDDAFTVILLTNHSSSDVNMAFPIADLILSSKD